MSHETASPVRVGGSNYVVGDTCTFHVVGSGQIEFSFMDAGTNARGHLEYEGSNIKDSNFYSTWDGLVVSDGDEFVFDSTTGGSADDGFEICIV